MLKYFLSALFLISITHLYSARISHFEEPKSDHVFILTTGTGTVISLADYIQLNPSDLKELTGHRLTLKERIAFKITQGQIKKTIRKDGTVDILAFKKKAKEPFKWHWGGFFLGMLVPIGFIITLFIKGEKRTNRITSALIGMAVALSIGLLIGILTAASDFL